MIKTEGQSLVESNKAFEFVTGSLAIIIVVILVLSFFQGNILFSLVFTALGTFVGILYSKRKFQLWPSFVGWQIAQDAKRPTITQRFFLGLICIIVIWFGVDIIGKFVNIRFDVLTEILEIMVGCYLGYFLWLLWLHNQLNKKAGKGF
jgi:hypothetical protein